MPTIRITKIFEFEMAHALFGYDGPCKNIHGHSYKLFVTVKGKVKVGSSSPKSTMVMDFSELKKIVWENIISKYDHSLVLDENIPHDLKLAANKMSEKIIYVNGMPTCELLTIIFSDILLIKIPTDIKLHHLKLQETATSFAEWFAEENH